MDMNVYVRLHKNASELFLFAKGDVSIRFNGKDDNVVLE